jgi:L-lactate dehydrogenase complex protein LldG
VTAAPSEPAESWAAQFAARAASVSADVRRAPASTVPALVAEIIRAAGATRAAVDTATRSAFPSLCQALAAAGVEAVDPRSSLEILADVGAGVSLAAFGIAETGSVALAAGDRGERLVGMLPAVHVVLLRETDLVADLDTAGARLRALTTADPPLPYVSFVTGPSRTADIERVRTIGVQGPRALHVIILDADPKSVEGE